MSLDLSPKNGYTTAGTFAAGITAFPVDGDLAAGDLTEANKVRAYIDTSGGPVTITPGALTGLEAGDTVLLIKATSDPNSISFTDGDGVVYNFVNRQSEYLCLEYDGVAWWVA